MISLRQHLRTRRTRSEQPKPYSHWYCLAFCGNRPDTDNDIDGACRRRQVPLQLPQKVFDGQSPSRANAAIIQHERFRYAQWLLQGRRGSHSELNTRNPDAVDYDVTQYIYDLQLIWSTKQQYLSNLFYLSSLQRADFFVLREIQIPAKRNNF